MQKLSSINYTFLKSSEDKLDFALIIYASNESELKNSLKKIEFARDIFEFNGNIDVDKLKDIVAKTKVEDYLIQNVNEDLKNIYIFGCQKNLIDFKTIWSLTMKYNAKIQQNQQESEVMKKKLTNLKKQYKVK